MFDNTNHCGNASQTHNKCYLIEGRMVVVKKKKKDKTNMLAIVCTEGNECLHIISVVSVSKTV